MFSVFQSSQLDYEQEYPAYHWSLVAACGDEQYLEWFQYARSSDKVLLVAAREVAFARRNADDVQMKCFDWSVPVKVKPGPRKTLKESRIAVNATYDSSSGFSGFTRRCPCCRR